MRFSAERYRLILALAVLLELSSSATRGSAAAADLSAIRVAQAQPSQLIDIVPASGPAGVAYPLRAVIRGTGFMPTGNVVEFGPIRIPDAPSTEGQITFAIPKEMPSRGEVPPAVLPPGEYRVTVTTTAGTSNALIFTLNTSP
jgi:hypothetical protein